MGAARERLIAAGLVLSPCLMTPAIAQTNHETTIPGNRGEIIMPVVPGPPTYTDPLPEPDNRRDTAFEAKPRADPACQYQRAEYVQGPGEPPFASSKIYSGWLASDLLGRAAYLGGKEIGEVNDIIVGAGGNISALEVKQRGLLEIDGPVLRVEWRELHPGRDGIVLRNPETLKSKNYDATAPIGKSEYRISDVRGDWTRIPIEGCSLRHGELSDVVFDAAGNILAIVEKRAAALGGGNFAYPFSGYSQGWKRLYGMLDLPPPRAGKPGIAVQPRRFASFVTSADTNSATSPAPDERTGKQ